ncbi:MAG: DUF4011 domain-containing protein [Alphaproteobacteria bacterium]|nr:DUF4011 domain-containing protein [Alphaproteobacteria bacterium]
MKPTELQNLVQQKIEHLRPKLLDLSRRNPLIATKLSPRSNTYIRVVDELPAFIFQTLQSGQEMRLIPLPDIQEDPRDEQSEAFRDALKNAQLTDEIYLKNLELVAPDASDYIDRTRQIERALKDRIRLDLRMPPRPKQADIQLVQHARNNGIIPSYDLPEHNSNALKDRYRDGDLQTLLLPTDLERKLNNIISKCRTWIQETGINVLHVAFGFLEWSEQRQTETSFAPLILLSAQIEKKRTREGVEFRITGTDEPAEINAVLAEKLRTEFGIELPKLDGDSIEDYFSAIARIAPRQIIWRVRRQVVIGVFPSARMAMYHDIDPKQPAFPYNTILQSLLGGSNSETTSPFAEEYNVDEPQIEKLVPWVVMDADSSQFSTLVDIANGKNVAVEGPPGTGKSQTIVNAIAAALAEGKKVLFVAEKLAALTVVRARLEAAGLGEFLLPLQAERSQREQVIGSVRSRMTMDTPTPVPDYDDRIAEYRRIRSQLADYINLLTLSYRTSGMTIHEILSLSIATSPRLDTIPVTIIDQIDIPEAYLNKTGIRHLRTKGDAILKAAEHAAEARPYWKATELTNADRFTVEKACRAAATASQAFRRLGTARDDLPNHGIDRNAATDDLKALHVALGPLATLGKPESSLYMKLLSKKKAAELKVFLDECDICIAQEQELASTIAVDLTEAVWEQIKRIHQICLENQFQTLDRSELLNILSTQRNALDGSLQVVNMMAPLIRVTPEAAEWNLAAIGRIARSIEATGRDALMCRNTTLNDPSALQPLRTLIAEGRRLQAERAELGKQMSIGINAPVEALTSAIAALRSAGLFSVFSARFRDAKRLARSLLLFERFDKQHVLQCLEKLADYRKRERTFQLNPKAAELFGFHFRGVDTEFEPFEKLVTFYTKTERILAGSSLRAFRTFLRDADMDELEAIPSIPVNTAGDTLVGVQNIVAETQRRIAALESSFEELFPMISIFRTPSSVSSASLAGLVRTMEAYLARRAALDGDQRAAALLGDGFAGSRTPTTPLKLACQWAQAATPIAEQLASVMRCSNAQEAVKQFESVQELLAEVKDALLLLTNVAQISKDVFTCGHNEMANAAALDDAANDQEGLFAHAALATTVAELRETKTYPLIRYRMAAGIPTGLAAQLEALAIRKLALMAFADHGRRLSHYSGSRLDELRATLARQDKKIIELSQKQIRWKIYSDAKPPSGKGIGKRSDWTDMALIQNETKKQQRFISVRDLTQRAGKALIELKPCWMMSPLAVAQYIPKDSLEFDLCIVDEASQMPPEAGIGAILRCKQLVVVGDINQLPPSNFFKKMIDDEGADEDEAVLNESILEMANATFQPARRLRWHYRSRHSGLIKFSNRIVYNDDLIVFPSATESMPRMGVEYRKVDGLYKSGTNPIEARKIVDAALEFMQSNPERSFGIVTLNQKQRDLIAEEFEYDLSNNSYAQAYVEAWKVKHEGLEEFFIKNLENVQGDERDVIYIGTVYGPEIYGGKVAQRFGPINGIAGKRRLNVLFSRAKEKIVTFSSMTSADIVAEEDGNAGAYMLKRWLEYAATGVLEGGKNTRREPDSELEVFVMEQLRAMGFEPVAQVGVAGYFVDIGVKHPDWPHGFVLGVECDGASYHSAKSARDRDRLRQEVLERLGWRFHRVWSTDWFNNPGREAERMRKAIEARMKVLKAQEQQFLS